MHHCHSRAGVPKQKPGKRLLHHEVIATQGERRDFERCVACSSWQPPGCAQRELGGPSKNRTKPARCGGVAACVRRRGRTVWQGHIKPQAPGPSGWPQEPQGPGMIGAGLVESVVVAKTDNSFSSSVEWQLGHWTVVWERTSASNFVPQSLQAYSKIGINPSHCA